MAKRKQQWPADQVERRKVAGLIPSARNARTHSEEQVKQIAASITEWGWTIPALIDPKGEIIAGHGRILAAQLLGLADVPVMVATGWTDAQKRAYRIADNQLAINADWDMDMLSAEMADLKLDGFELDLTGFGEIELADLLADRTEGETDPDDVPATPADPVTVLGDTWLLGKHRLRCGDSTSADDVAALLNGVEPHLMVTDPPYGVEYDPNWRNEASRWAGSKVKLGAIAVGKVTNDDRADWRDAWALFPGGVAYVWFASLSAGEVGIGLIESGFVLRSLIIWDKTRHVIGRGHYHWQHEPCWYAVRKGSTGHWSGDRKQTTLWSIPKQQTSETGHSTQKPVECMRRPIVNNSSPGQAVYEPFSGSGTTIIAGEMEGRHIYAMEISPAYVDVAVNRWQAFTGQDATLEATGEIFNMREAA